MNRKIKQKLKELKADSWTEILIGTDQGADDLKLWGKWAATCELLDGSVPEDLLFGLNAVYPQPCDYKSGFAEICKLFKGLI